MPRVRGLAFTLIPALGTMAACTAEADVPQGPNLDALVEAYEHPTSELDVEQAERYLGDSLALQLLIHLAGRLTFVSNAVEGIVKGLGPDALINLGGQVQGHVAVRTVCPGEDHDARVAERDGTLQVEAPIRDSVLGPVAFGSARQCAFDFGDVPLPPWLTVPIDGPFPGNLDGPLALHLGRVSLREPIVIQPLVSVEGTLSIDRLPSISHFDFRLPGGMVVETRVTLPDGTHAIAFVDQTEVGLREKRGTWKCTVSRTTLCLPEF